MKIIVIGGTGKIGNAVVQELSERHEVIPVSHKGTKITCDLNEPASIKAMFEKIGQIDAVIFTSGFVHFAPFMEMTVEKYRTSLEQKLASQIQIVLTGLPFIRDGGSFTLTSGILSRDPIRCGSAATAVNSAIEGFVKAAAIELPRGIRINAISPTVIQESFKDFAELFRGFIPVPSSKVAIAYSKSVEGAQTGQTYYITN